MQAGLRRIAPMMLAVLLVVCGPARGEYLVPEAHLTFPDRLGAHTLAGGEKFPRAELGHGIQYRGPGLSGSVYVYRGGHTTVPDGIGSGIVRAEFAKARGDVATVAKMRGDPEPQLLSERTMRAASTEFLTATYRLRRGDALYTSLVGITGARGHFIKLRASVNAAGEAAANDINAFVAAIARLVAGASGSQGAPPVMAAR
jgi:hypothetical protein